MLKIHPLLHIINANYLAVSQMSLVCVCVTLRKLIIVLNTPIIPLLNVSMLAFESGFCFYCCTDVACRVSSLDYDC